MRVALLLVVCLLAGCASPSPAPQDAGANVTRANAPASGAGPNASALAPSTTPPKVTLIKVSVASGEPGLGPRHPLSEPTDSEKGALALDATTRVVLVEAKWSCASPSCGFFLWVLGKDGNPIDSATGQGDARIKTTKLTAPGTYTLALRSSGPAAQMTGEIRASAFDGAVPDGYSAFAGGKSGSKA